MAELTKLQQCWNLDQRVVPLFIRTEDCAVMSGKGVIECYTSDGLQPIYVIHTSSGKYE